MPRGVLHGASVVGGRASTAATGALTRSQTQPGGGSAPAKPRPARHAYYPVGRLVPAHPGATHPAGRRVLVTARVACLAPGTQARTTIRA